MIIIFISIGLIFKMFIDLHGISFLFIFVYFQICCLFRFETQVYLTKNIRYFFTTRFVKKYTIPNLGIIKQFRYFCNASVLYR